MVPIENYGVKCMSMGLLVETDAAFVWRGPMVCLPCYQCLLEDAFVLTLFYLSNVNGLVCMIFTLMGGPCQSNKNEKIMDITYIHTHTHTHTQGDVKIWYVT